MTPRTDPRLKKQFGLQVRARRKDMKLTQEVVGERAGLHRTYISRVERGKNNVTLGIIMRLAQVLETTPSKLLDGVEDGVVAIPEWLQ